MDPNPNELETLRAKVRDLEERLGILTGLEERVYVAETRALDAERRLQELTGQIAASGRELSSFGSPDTDAGSAEPQLPESDDLRARLARTASRKKAGGGADR